MSNFKHCFTMGKLSCGLSFSSSSGGIGYFASPKSAFSHFPVFSPRTISVTPAVPR
jgi:hypothetical protein